MRARVCAYWRTAGAPVALVCWFRRLCSVRALRGLRVHACTCTYSTWSAHTRNVTPAWRRRRWSHARTRTQNRLTKGVKLWWRIFQSHSLQFMFFCCCCWWLVFGLAVGTSLKLYRAWQRARAQVRHDERARAQMRNEWKGNGGELRQDRRHVYNGVSPLELHFFGHYICTARHLWFLWTGRFLCVLLLTKQRYPVAVIQIALRIVRILIHCQWNSRANLHSSIIFMLHLIKHTADLYDVSDVWVCDSQHAQAGCCDTCTKKKHKSHTNIMGMKYSHKGRCPSRVLSKWACSVDVYHIRIPYTSTLHVCVISSVVVRIEPYAGLCRQKDVYII